jgi:hypothetical protein
MHECTWFLLFEISLIKDHIVGIHIVTKLIYEFKLSTMIFVALGGIAVIMLAMILNSLNQS